MVMNTKTREMTKENSEPSKSAGYNDEKVGKDFIT